MTTVSHGELSERGGPRLAFHRSMPSTVGNRWKRPGGGIHATAQIRFYHTAGIRRRSEESILAAYLAFASLANLQNAKIGIVCTCELVSAPAGRESTCQSDSQVALLERIWRRLPSL